MLQAVVHSVIAQAIALMAAAVAIVLLLRALVGRVVRNDERERVADTVMEPLAGVYGLLLAFLIGGAADRANTVLAAMQLETESYNRIERIARHFPEPLDTQIRETLQEYARTEAQARQGLRPGSESIALLNRMWLSVAEFEPGGGAQNLLQSEALLELSVLRMQRGVAARAARHEHGPLIWMVLIVGSVSIIGVCILSGAGDPHTPYYLVALTALISVSLYVLYALSRPMLAVPFQTVLNAAPH